MNKPAWDLELLPPPDPFLNQILGDNLGMKICNNNYMNKNIELICDTTLNYLFE